MTRIIVLGRKEDTSRFLEQLLSAIELAAVPHGVSTYEHVNVNGEPIVVCGLSGRGRSGPTLQVSLVKQLLLLEGTEAAAVIEFDDNPGVRTARQAFDDHWSKGIVE